MEGKAISTLFLDIGGVLLTNAWGRNSRALAATTFKLDIDEINERHHLCFDTYEMGKLTMDAYLKQVIFYEPRSFSYDEFKSFVYAQSKPFPETIKFFLSLKSKFGLKIFSVNNEAKEMNEYRIKQFALHELFDAFISSCYVGLRKPDTDIFKIACNLAQVAPVNAIMIDDRQMFVEVAAGIGINAIRYDDLTSVKKLLKAFFNEGDEIFK